MPDNSLLPTSQYDRLTLAVEAFLTAKEGARCSARTLEAYSFALRKFTTWLRAQGVTDPAAITPHHVRLYFVELGKSTLAAGSVHDYARPVRTWLRFLYADGIIPADVMARVQMPRLDKTILPSFTPSEVFDLLEACKDAQDPERDTALVLFLLDSGVRASELCALTIGDVDAKTGAVMVRLGKGGKDRTCYIGARARRALLRYLLERPHHDPSAPLFPSLLTDGHLTANGLLLFCRRLGLRAGVPDCHPHKFRRTFAIESLRAGMDLVRLAALMGHSDLTMLRRYLALVEHDLAAAHREHGAAASMLAKKGR
jgi:integrase/recombinase XerD